MSPQHFFDDQQKLGQSSQLVNDMLKKIEGKDTIDRIFLFAMEKYSLEKYKAYTKSSDCVKNLLLELTYSKFYSRNSFLEDRWSKKELTIFVWFMAVYTFLYNRDIEEMTEEQWDEIGTVFLNKSSSFLHYEAKCLLKSDKIIRKWQEEEIYLLSVLCKEKNRKWKEISKQIFYRSNQKYFKNSKQCREYWINHLDCTKQKGHWSALQSVKLLFFIFYFGRKWAYISKCLQTRTQHSVKNHYHYLQKTFYKLQNNQALVSLINLLCDRQKIQKSSIEQEILKFYRTNQIQNKELSLNLNDNFDQEFYSDNRSQNNNIIDAINESETHKNSQMERQEQKIQKKRNLEDLENAVFSGLFEMAGHESKLNL